MSATRENLIANEDGPDDELLDVPMTNKELRIVIAALGYWQLESEDSSPLLDGFITGFFGEDELGLLSSKGIEDLILELHCTSNFTGV